MRTVINHWELIEESQQNGSFKAGQLLTKLTDKVQTQIQCEFTCNEIRQMHQSKQPAESRTIGLKKLAPQFYVGQSQDINVVRSNRMIHPQFPH